MQYYNRSQNKKKVTVQIWKSCSCELEEIRLNPLLHLLCIWTISRNDYKGFLPTEIIIKKIQEGSASVTDISSLLKMRHLGLDCLSQLAVTLCCYSPYLVHCLLNCRSTANLCLVLTPSPHQGKSVHTGQLTPLCHSAHLFGIHLLQPCDAVVSFCVLSREYHYWFPRQLLTRLSQTSHKSCIHKTWITVLTEFTSLSVRWTFWSIRNIQILSDFSPSFKLANTSTFGDVEKKKSIHENMNDTF